MRVDEASLLLAHAFGHALGFLRQAQPARLALALALGLLLQGARRAPWLGQLYDERESTWWGHTAGGKAPAVSQTTPVRPGGANAERGHECGCIHAPSSSWWRASPWPRQRTIPTCRTRQTQSELGETARIAVVATSLLYLCDRLSNPVSRPDAAVGGTRVRPTRLWWCVHVRVPWIRAGGATQRRYCKPSERVNKKSRLAPALRRLVL
jgi:hypothetical protein